MTRAGRSAVWRVDPLPAGRFLACLGFRSPIVVRWTHVQMRCARFGPHTRRHHCRLNMLRDNMFQNCSTVANDKRRQLLSARVFIARRGRKARKSSHRERKSSPWARGLIDWATWDTGLNRSGRYARDWGSDQSRSLYCNDSRASHRLR